MRIIPAILLLGNRKGMPYGKYTFQIVQKDKNVLAGQWDGIYEKKEFLIGYKRTKVYLTILQLQK